MQCIRGNSLTKTQLLKQISLIVFMNEQELLDTEMKISISNIDSKSKAFLYKGIELSRVRHINNSDSLVVCSSIKEVS